MEKKFSGSLIDLARRKCLERRGRSDHIAVGFMRHGEDEKLGICKSRKQNDENSGEDDDKMFHL